MTDIKENNAEVAENENFDGPDEYDVVSSHDLMLLSDEIDSNNLENDTSGLFYNKKFSSVKQYEEEWNELYLCKEIDLDKLKQKCVEGQLRTSHFRSICWRCLLGILHAQPKQWLCQLQMYRKHYDEISVELEKNPWNVGEQNPFDNPLSQESDSIWQRYFCDEELKSVVQQDVRRTFPGMDFFRKEDIQEMMVRILFCYARQNPALCYRQGMHEILAPLIFILHCDHQAFLHAKEQNMTVDESICEILNPEFLEQDAFSIFKFIMNHIEYSYRNNNVIPAGCFPVDIQNESKTYHNEVRTRLTNIQKNILQPKDPDLTDHLEKLDIPLHLFGIRWLRLLFGREFILQDLLVLWDFIFANNFEIVNYIVVAMLVAIRQILLNGDYTDCMSNLMRYPSGIDITYIIEYSLHLRDPKRHPPPDPMKASSLPQAYNHRTPKNFVNNSQPNRRLKKGPTQWLSDKSNLLFLGQSGDGDSGVVPGYAINDPKLLRAELDQAKMIMNIVCHKLVQFHSALNMNLPKNTKPEVQVVLDGIYELSCLLKNHYKEVNCEIETACEAGETKEQRNDVRKMGTREAMKPPMASINSARRSHTLPRIKKGPPSGELTVFKHHIGGPISGAPMTDPLHLIKNLT